MLAELGDTCGVDPQSGEEWCSRLEVPDTGTPVFQVTGTAPRVCGKPWLGEINNCLVVAVLGIGLLAMIGGRR